MRTADMLPIAEKLDNIGYHSLEVWGGATFDVCLRYLNEDPWERLRQLKKHIRHTPLQMLLRGQSLVGYRPYPDDVVEAFITRAVDNGINIIRIFYSIVKILRFVRCFNPIFFTSKHSIIKMVFSFHSHIISSLFLFFLQ
jgi:oxaloacetate decarboxylase alpha subunit